MVAHRPLFEALIAHIPPPKAAGDAPFVSECAMILVQAVSSCKFAEAPNEPAPVSLTAV